MRLTALLLFIVSSAYASDYVIDADSQNPSTMTSVNNLYVGDSGTMTINFKNNGSDRTVGTNEVVTFWYGTNNLLSDAISKFTATGTNVLTFASTNFPVASPDTGSWTCGVALDDKMYGHSKLYVLPNPFYSSTNHNLVLIAQTNIDYSVVTQFYNVATQGPYRAGTNITFSSNSDGSVDINTGAGGDMLKSTYDTDDDGVVDNSEALKGNTNTPVYAESDPDFNANGMQLNADNEVGASFLISTTPNGRVFDPCSSQLSQNGYERLNWFYMRAKDSGRDTTIDWDGRILGGDVWTMPFDSATGDDLMRRSYADARYATAAQGTTADAATPLTTHNAHTNLDADAAHGELDPVWGAVSNTVTTGAALGTTATQPGDNATTLGSGAATDGQVLTADGAGNTAWEDSGAIISGIYTQAFSTNISFNCGQYAAATLTSTNDFDFDVSDSQPLHPFNLVWYGTNTMTLDANLIQFGDWTPTGTNVLSFTPVGVGSWFYAPVAK